MPRTTEYWDNLHTSHGLVYHTLLANDIHINQAAWCLLGHNMKISAIKYVRRVTGWGLRESKEYVDAMERFEL